MTPTLNRYKSTMPNLELGDVITSLKGDSACDLKVLVLDRKDDGSIELSVGSRELRITRDKKGPFRWDPKQSYLVDRNGIISDHVGFKSVVQKKDKDGLLAAASYRRLRKILEKGCRLKLSKEAFLRLFKDEPNLVLMFDAIIEDDSLTFLEKVEFCSNIAFSDLEDGVSRRQMARTSMFVAQFIENLQPKIDLSICMVSSDDEFQGLLDSTPKQALQ